MRGRVQITAGFWVMALCLWLLDPQLLAPTAAAALLHEGGHLAAMWGTGARDVCLSLTAAGPVLTARWPRLSYRRELLVAAAGPLFSLLWAWLAVRWGHYLSAGVSLALGLFNLLPVPPLDGGRIWGALCALTLPPALCHQAVRWAAILTAGLVLGLSVAAFPRFGGATVLLSALYLVYQSLRGSEF